TDKRTRAVHHSDRDPAKALENRIYSRALDRPGQKSAARTPHPAPDGPPAHRPCRRPPPRLTAAPEHGASGRSGPAVGLLSRTQVASMPLPWRESIHGSTPDSYPPETSPRAAHSQGNSLAK